MSSECLSKLSKSDRNCVEFTRCLYKAKSVVQELEAFSQIIGPSMCSSPPLSHEKKQAHYDVDECNRHAYQYMDESFKKFKHMCRVLLIVLAKLESNHPVKKERIDSFRQEVIDEWNKATRIKHNLLSFIQYQSSRNSLPSPPSSSDPEN